MKLEVALLAGNETKQFLTDLTHQIDRLEKLYGVKVLAKAATSDNDAEEIEEGDEIETASLKNGKKKGATSNFDEADLDDTVGDDDDAPIAASAKRGRPKKLTTDDVNTACKEKVAALIEDQGMSGKDARKVVLTTLKKKFGVTSISELDADQYADVVKAMAV